MDNNILAYTASVFSEFLYTSPDKKQWNNIKENNLLLEWFIHSNSDISKEALNLWKKSHETETYLDLATDFTDLFICDEISLKAPPYGSFYLAISGELYSSECDKVKTLYKQHSFFSKKLFEEASDHIATELEFLSTILNNIQEKEQLTLILKEFLQVHFIPWIKIWVIDLQSNAKSSFYKGLGYFMEDYCDILINKFEIKDINRTIYRKAS